MSYCNTCHKPETRCGCTTGQHPSTPDPYAHYCPPHEHRNVPLCLPRGESCKYGPAQPVNNGIFQALNSCGQPVPYAKVTVLYASSGEHVPLYYRPIANPQYGQSNPVITDEKGRAPIFFFSQGHDVKIIVECKNSDGSYTLIDSFIQYGATYQDNFDLSTIEDKECVTIANPRILIYDKDNCNIPWAFMDLRFAMIRANIDAGLPAGSYEDTKAYYECLGEPWPNCIVVYGNCECGCPRLFRYKAACEDCCPPDPCDVEFDKHNEHECWTDCTTCEDVKWEGETVEWEPEGELVAPPEGDLPGATLVVTATERARVVHIKCSWANPFLYSGVDGLETDVTTLRVALKVKINGGSEVITEVVGMLTPLRPLTLNFGSPQYIQMFRVAAGDTLTIEANPVVVESSGRSDRSINQVRGSISARSWEVCDVS